MNLVANNMHHVLITGSTRGIGLGLAQELLQSDCRITLNGTSEASLQKTLPKLIQSFGADKVQGFAADVRSFDAVQQLCEEASKGFGAIDIWINNAGVDQPRKLFWELDPSEYERILQINIRGMMYGTQIAIKHMLENQGGTVYNMAGFGSDGRMRPTMSIYGLSKRGLDYFTRSMMKEVNGTRVKVGLLSPGMVMTDLIYGSIDPEPGQDKEAKMIFNILADRP